MTDGDRFGGHSREIYALALLVEDLGHRHLSTIEAVNGQDVVVLPAVHADQILTLVGEIVRRAHELEGGR